MTDYDAPRHPVAADAEQEALIDLKTRRTEARSGVADVGEAEVVTTSGYAVTLDVVGEDGDDLSVPVQPQRNDEFLCTKCFLVLHHSRRSPKGGRRAICQECA